MSGTGRRPRAPAPIGGTGRRRLAKPSRGGAGRFVVRPGRGQSGITTPNTSSLLVVALFARMWVNASAKATAPVWL